MLTELQRAKITRFFLLLDRDVNGRIEIDDFYRVADELCAHRGWSAESEEGRELYRTYEKVWRDVREYANGESVPVDAFLEYHARMLPRAGAYDDGMGRVAAVLFSTLDEDGDGHITLDEHRTFCRIFGFDPSLADAVFPRWDTDGDGLVSLDELGEVVREFFYASDPAAPGNWLFGPMASSLEEIRVRGD